MNDQQIKYIMQRVQEWEAKIRDTDVQYDTELEHKLVNLVEHGEVIVVEAK